MRRPARSVTRVAANQPPSTASGSASTQSSTRENDGAPGQSEPSTASTPANGSAGPTTSTPRPRSPQAASFQSAPTVSRSGSRAPPPSTGHARIVVKVARLTTSAASTAQAPPPEKNRSSLADPPSLPWPSSSRRRRSELLTRSGAMLDQLDVRNERMRARERAIAPKRNIAVTAAAHSGATASGLLPIRSVIDRQSASGSRLNQCSGTAIAGA